MEREWDETPRTPVNRWSKLYASINPKGDIRICRKIHEMIGSPDSVLLLYERKTRTIGIKAAPAESPNRFENNPRGRSGGRYIGAKPLLRRHDIRLPYSVRFPSASVDDEKVLTLDFREAVPVRAADRKPDALF
jgi:hypothetical protein